MLMRDILKIIAEAEEQNLPQWFTDAPVVDVLKVSPDAEFILDGDEWDYEWRLCDIPAAAFAAHLGPDWETFFANLCPGEPREREAERVASIEQWMDQGGSFESHPVIVLLNGGKLQLLDGWHRLGVAVHKRGATSIRAVVAIDPA